MGEDKSIKVDLDESLSMDSFNKKFSSVSGNLFKTFDFLPSRNELKTLEAELPKSIDSFFLTFKVAESDSEKLKELIKSIKEDDSVVYVLETDSKQREKRMSRRNFCSEIRSLTVRFSIVTTIRLHFI